MATLSASNEALRARADELRRRLAFLQSQQPSPSSSTSALPSFQPSARISSSQTTSLPSREPTATEEAQELARKYRISGRSSFPVELARGARAKEELEGIERERKRQKSKGKGKVREDRADVQDDGEFARRGTAVRLETFYEGRYYEPYFVVFANRLPNLDGGEPADTPLYIAHHTIPHWVPLSQLAWRYLGVRLGSEDADAAERVEAEKGGEADLDLFLTHLSAYLNAYVSRREQLVVLRSAFSSDYHPFLHFRIFASEPCDRIMVEWDIPPERARTQKAKDEDEEEESEEELEEGAEPERTVVMQIALHDLRLERIEKVGDEDGASLLVRYVEKRPTDLVPAQAILETLTTRVLRGKGGKTIEQVVRELVEHTVQAGWSPENT